MMPPVLKIGTGPRWPVGGSNPSFSASDLRKAVMDALLSSLRLKRSPDRKSLELKLG